LGIALKVGTGRGKANVDRPQGAGVFVETDKAGCWASRFICSGDAFLFGAVLSTHFLGRFFQSINHFRVARAATQVASKGVAHFVFVGVLVAI